MRDSNIAFFFRGHNILEYKSPEDHLDIDTFSKTLAYAYLYKSYGKTLDEIKTDDITISIVREAKPAGLFRYFREHGCSVSTRYSGIYDGRLSLPASWTKSPTPGSMLFLLNWIKGISEICWT